MTLVSRLSRRSLEDPRLPITDVSLAAMLGGEPTASGEAVSEEGSLSIGAVLRGASIIASTVASLPLKLRADGGETVDAPWLGTSPTTGITGFERTQTLCLHMVLWGNAFLFKVFERGRLIDLIPVHPSRVDVRQQWLGRERIAFVKRFVIDGAVTLDTGQMLHVPGLSTDGLKGMSPVSKARQMLGTALAGERTAGRMFDQGLMLAGVLETEQRLVQEQADRLKGSWRRRLLGAAHVGEIAVLDSGAKFRQLAMSPEDAQFLESRRFSVTEIARWLGLPGWMVNDQEKSTSWGTGMEQQFSVFVKVTLSAYLRAIESRLSSEAAAPGQWAEFVIEGLLRGDSAARSAFYASGIVNGWLVPNEVRRLENLPPVPWGDEPYLPHNTPASADPAAPGDAPDGAGNEEEAA